MPRDGFERKFFRNFGEDTEDMDTPNLKGKINFNLDED